MAAPYPTHPPSPVLRSGTLNTHGSGLVKVRAIRILVREGRRGKSRHAVFRSHDTAVGVSINKFKQEQISGVEYGASERYLIYSHGRVVKLGSLTWHRFVLSPPSSLSVITIQLQNSVRFTVVFLVYC